MEVTAFLDEVRALGDAVTVANRPGNMVEYARLYSLMDRKRKQTSSRRGEVFYEQLRHRPGSPRYTGSATGAVSVGYPKI